MTAKFVKVSIFPLQHQVVYDIFHTFSVNEKVKYFYSENESGCDFLELQALDDLSDIDMAISNTEYTKKRLLMLLSGDVQSELLTLIDDPLNLDSQTLPDSEIIQLRHIEVLPIIYNNYRQWRNNTIFEVVRNHKDIIKSFGAYHSVISDYPGVTFIAATDEQHLPEFDEAFTNEHYKEILVQAGNNYIIGGTDKGLDTKYYRTIKLY